MSEHIQRQMSTRIARSLAGSWPKLWPFERGRFLYQRIVTTAVRAGLMSPVWYEIEDGLWMNLDIRDMIQETILDAVSEPS